VPGQQRLRLVSTEQAETTLLPLPPPLGPLTVAQALRNAVQRSVGGDVLTAEGEPLGFRMATDLNGDPVIIGRTYTNVGLVDTQGVDFGLQYFITNKLNLQATYSWFDFEIIDSDEEIQEPGRTSDQQGEPRRLLVGQLGGEHRRRWVEEFRCPRACSRATPSTRLICRRATASTITSVWG
jgi:hypothetical protein